MKIFLFVFTFLLSLPLSFAFLEGHPQASHSQNQYTKRSSKENKGIERLKRIRNTLRNLKPGYKSQNEDQRFPQETPKERAPMQAQGSTQNPESTRASQFPPPVSPSPFLVPESALPIVAPQTHKPVDLDEKSTPRVAALLNKCVKLGAYFKQDSPDQQRALELYQIHCSEVVEQIAIPQKLDLLYWVQAKYLEIHGKYREANRYHTLLYQMNPQDFSTTLDFIQNLKNLGEAEMAVDLLGFFQESPAGRILEDEQRRILQELETDLNHILGKPD